MALHDQLKQRRKALGLQQTALQLRIGMNQQHYQRIEAGGNPRLDTLALIVNGLDAELVLVPKEKLAQVMAVLETTGAVGTVPPAPALTHSLPSSIPTGLTPGEDPWAGLLGQHAR